jgi:hypothetical protein
MAKTLKEAPITTANARAKLPAGLHWRSLDPDVHLGYRKGRRGGVWLVRWRNGVGYRQKPIGTADDAIKEGTLDFTLGIAKARLREPKRAAIARADHEHTLAKDMRAVLNSHERHAVKARV